MSEQRLTGLVEYLRTPEEADHWLMQGDGSEIGDLPQFALPEPARQKRRFPDYQEDDLIALALRLTFVGGEGVAASRVVPSDARPLSAG